MNFNDATYLATIKAIRDAIERTTNLINDFTETVSSFLVLKSIQIAMTIRESIARFKAAANLTLTLIREELKGYLAPILFFKRGAAWHNHVKGPMHKFAASVSSDKLLSADQWEGAAGNRYREATADQKPAGEACATIGSQMGTQLMWCAGGGLAFYTAIAVALGKFIVALVRCAAAATTGAGSILAPIAAAAASIATTSQIIAACVTLATFLTTQVTTINQLNSVFSEFPYSHWPSGTSKK